MGTPLEEILLTLAYTSLFVYIIYKAKFFLLEGLSRKLLVGIFALKIIAGILLFLLYTYYYTDRSTADIFKYFDDSQIVFNLIYSNPIHFFQVLFGINMDSEYLIQYMDKTSFWYKPLEPNMYNDNRIIIRFNAFLRLFSLGYYQVHNVVINFLSFAGLVAIYKSFTPYFIDKRRLLAIAVFLLPSVMFWGSGLLKEGLVFFGLGFLIYYSFKITISKSPLHTLWILLALVLIGLVKPYILIAILPAILSYMWVKQSNGTKPVLKYIVVHTLLLILGLNLHWTNPKYDPLQIITNKQINFIRHAEFLKSGSRIELSPLEPDVLSFVKNAPVALYNSLIRPHIFEARSPIILLAALENMVILITIVLCIAFLKTKGTNINMLLFCISFVTILYILIGLTTPVLGALVRYKAPALPFLMIIFISLIDIEKLTTRLPFIKKLVINQSY